ncbi:MAG: recombinase family protein [Alteraurantiacibacter sp.]
MSSKVFRCAVYTRKSSDEGLEQSFNSLDAQREAGEAYVLSQASEGWTLLPDRYDDGGFSGGSMERPGLQKLLADIAAGKIDIVVVYKIDRLTRSLADFARIVEVFEAAGTSFVSVTQSFNTTTSMGRLMLNVLLSFAQFEREVTGERIRDKIAASKAKGLWMGGVAPLGYDLPAAGTRVLWVNQAEAVTVRHLFTRYLELGSVHALQRELVEQGIRSKSWVTRSGKAMGGLEFSRGALFHLLRNQIYLGRIVHKELTYPGEHPAIIDQSLFDKVQQHLDGNARRHKTQNTARIGKAMLAGKLFDAAGEPMSPTTSRGKSGRSYRYYVSASLQQGRKVGADRVTRLSALAIERVIAESLARWMPEERDPQSMLQTVRLEASGIAVELTASRPKLLASRLALDEELVIGNARTCTIHLPLALPQRGGKRQITATCRSRTSPDSTLIGALRKAHAMLDRDRGRPTLTEAPVSPYDKRILRLAFLFPDLQRDILAGRQPVSLNLENVMAREIPLAWSAQRKMLGWG